MQQIYSFFYKQYGVRRLQTLLSPRTFILEQFPKNSAFHYADFNTDNNELDVSKLYFNGYSKKIALSAPEELKDNKGRPVRKSTLLKTILTPFVIKHSKTFRYIKDPHEIIKDELTLLVYNYNYLNELYRYIDMPMIEYFKWWNIQKTLWSNINSIANVTDRNHFININVTNELPSYSLLKMYIDRVNVTMTKIFNTTDKLIILELWKWLSVTHRQNSIFADLDNKNINKVNLLFTTPDNKSVVINLGYLNSWIKGTENTSDLSNTSQLSSDQIQKIFLKFLMTVNSISIPVITKDDSETELTIDKPNSEVITDNEDKQEILAIRDETEDYFHDHTGEEEDPVTDANVVKTIPLTYIKPSDNSQIITKVTDDDLNKDLSQTSDINSYLDDIDQNLNILETINKKQLKDKGIHVDNKGDEIENIEEITVNITDEEIHNMIYESNSFNETVLKQAEEYADFGLLSAAEYRKVLLNISKFKEMPDPYGSKEKIIDKIIIKPEDIRINEEKIIIADNALVLDKTMLKSSLLSFDEDYINNIHQKDILAMVSSIQKSGIVINKYEIEYDHTALGSYEHHRIELKPLDGSPSVVHFRIPKINSDGSFIANGNKYFMRKQRSDNPIRKIDPNIVALTSYYGKTFVTRNQLRVNSSLSYIIKILNTGITTEHPFIKNVAPAKVFDNNFKAPYIYNALADNFKGFKVDNFNFVFDYTDRIALFSKDILEKIETDGKIVCGFNEKIEPILVDENNEFFIHSKNVLIPIGDIYHILKVDTKEVPVDFSEIRIFSKTIPVGVVLGYFIGFKNLIRLLKAKYRIVEGRKNKELQHDEYAITFKDVSYIFSRKDSYNSLILSGYLAFEKIIKQYEFKEFNKKDVYLNLLDSKGLSSIYIRELISTDKLFVDPITKSILEEMNEPVTFRGLLIKATEMLTRYDHPDSQDMAYMRIKGYERISGTIYKELTAAIRQFNNKNISGKSKIDISPYQIWQTIMKDPSIKLAEDINPIQNLKEIETVTYVGEGGRAKESMNKASRAYHVNDMGIISEATVDSSDVGINTYLSTDPNFKDLRGLSKDKKTYNPSNIISTSAMLAPGMDHDDGKRVNFISIQQSHTIASDGYRQPYVRTGYESVIANRTSGMFAFTAKADGEVISLNNSGIIIQYKNGEKIGLELGRIHGKAEGSIYPHDIVSNMKLGDKFKKGDVVCYNTGFFEQDILDPKKIIMKNAMNVKVALYESDQTHEDSSSISKSISTKLNAKTTKVKSLVVDFRQNLINMVKEGQTVKPKDNLVIIEDTITSTTSAFDEETLAMLQNLSNQSPKAKYNGVVDKIEVFYHGDKDDMSVSLRALADKSDKNLATIKRSSNSPVITGEVNSEYRVGGTPLSLDKAEIRIYVTIETSAGVGDKGVYANQLKSVFGEVLEKNMTTELGQSIDAVFGYRSISARIVLSPYIIGTTTSLLKTIAEKAVKIYKG